MAQNRSYRIAAIVSEDLGNGFSLAGVEILPANDAELAMKLLTEAVTNRRWGIVIVDESLLEGVDERDRNELLGRTIPLVITIPGTMRWRDVERVSSEDFVARLIRRAVGYQLNIQI